ncbi:NADP-dependent 3-hydroxy acid dehydrogenase [Sparassis crispa]|uniref:NADP-dependent 3-hydroxy acid dehydrogenase n=1 Tax=Sparassis crispa TaxID=139825 RepID=A0A401GPX7_9APHY|nr:NADP-dependent 3-hydroxy acid dehydrogenase [Sparassis crispa]GBE84252.1 NADP-dependent 3-hydroxy acid dehydrogenase [Sparassis crispa]
MSSKVWLITGTSSGIGLALAQHVLAQGDKVIATVRSMSKYPQELKGAEPLVLDLGAPDSEIRKVGEAALKVYGHVDVLVNNAGYGLSGPVEELNMKDVRAQFQTNVFGTIVLTQSLLPYFRARKTGHIFNLTSVAAYWNYPGWGAYVASKAALDAFSESLSREVEPYNIRVIVILPGYFPTKFFTETRSAEQLTTVYTDPTQGYKTREMIPQGRHEGGQVGDVDKFAQRTYEIVYGTGMAKGLVESQGGKREWMRLPMGTDCGELMLAKINIVKENVESFEPIWRSTDVERERLNDFAQG